MGITHRDIKPGNLILTEAPAGTPMPAGVPFVKVGDFGLAKFSDRQMDATITIDQGVSGTPFYMSAEQIQALEIDHRSDIYSLRSNDMAFDYRCTSGGWKWAVGCHHQQNET